MPGSPLPSELVGGWTFERTVLDRLTGMRGDVVGALAVVDHGGRLGLHETGVLSWAGRATPVERTTYLEVRDGAVWATFADGRPFHPWRLGADIVHPCGEDTYVGRVDLAGGILHTVWRVTGPAKDQLLTTGLRRR